MTNLTNEYSIPAKDTLIWVVSGLISIYLYVTLLIICPSLQEKVKSYRDNWENMQSFEMKLSLCSITNFFYEISAGKEVRCTVETSKH